MQNLLEELKNVLQADDRLVVDGELVKNKVIELGLQLDEQLLALLLKHEGIKKQFFKEVNGILIFDAIKFQKLISNKQFLPDSYTAFKNKIGLIADDETNDNYLYKSNDIVLAWPHKDCLLEGGQTKEEQKRNEIFWNETLAPDTIDRLLEPKALKNFKLYDEKGQHTVSKISAGDNLIVKGNNLLALHTLKKVYQEKVKLIYIDPPYNTGNDGFNYNDKFSHSSWLTFMKNRLNVSKDFLSKEGVILIQIDNSPSGFDESPELGYLLVLMDEVFGRRNYVTTFTWKKKGNPSNTENKVGTITESIIMYAKDIDSVNPNMQEYKRKYAYEEDGKPYNLEYPVKTNSGSYKRSTMTDGIKTPEGTFYPPEGKRWTIGADTAKDIVKNGKYIINDGKFKIKKFKEDYIRGDSKLYNNLLLDHGSLKSAKSEIASLGFNREDFSSPKPEALIKFLLEIVCSKGDIVMDYHLGSGTTTAVAHKMGMQYIGIEQMDYIESIAVERMKKVIKGDNVGISKEIKWKGGGSFIYCELAALNDTIINRITTANSQKELVEILSWLKGHLYTDYRLQDLQAHINDFKNLELEQQQQVLIDMLDKNMLYIPYSELENEDFKEYTSDEMIAINKSLFNE